MGQFPHKHAHIPSSPNRTPDSSIKAISLTIQEGIIFPLVYVQTHTHTEAYLKDYFLYSQTPLKNNFSPNFKLSKYTTV